MNTKNRTQQLMKVAKKVAARRQQPVHPMAPEAQTQGKLQSPLTS